MEKWSKEILLITVFTFIGALLGIIGNFMGMSIYRHMDGIYSIYDTIIVLICLCFILLIAGIIFHQMKLYKEDND